MIFYGMSHITKIVVRNWKNTRIKMNSVIRFALLCFHVILIFSCIKQLCKKLHTLRKLAYIVLNYKEFFFFLLDFFYIFHNFAQNIYCGYSSPSGSNEYPQSVFWIKNKKISMNDLTTSPDTWYIRRTYPCNVYHIIYSILCSKTRMHMGIVLLFIFLVHNIDFEYSFELPCRGFSNVCPQSIEQNEKERKYFHVNLSLMKVQKSQ